MRSTLLRHTSKTSIAAAVDRYATIRQFFRQHAATPPLPNAWAGSSRGSYATLKVSLTFRDGSINAQRRTFLSTTSLREEPNGKTSHNRGGGEQHEGRNQGPSPPPEGPSSNFDPRNLENYPRFFRRLAMSLPHMHRPTRDDFLKAANGFWQRARVRFKWLTIRSFRKYNADEISAFVTWFLMSQTLWLFVGT